MVQVTSYKDKLKSQKAEFVYLVKADSKGQRAWFYTEVDKQKLPLFKEAIKQEQLDLTKYGKILFSGWGEVPPADVEKRLEEQYAN